MEYQLSFVLVAFVLLVRMRRAPFLTPAIFSSSWQKQVTEDKDSEAKIQINPLLVDSTS